jgi:hypothetical protein
MNTSNKKVLCITGMHRSGTSLVAMWLERCGVSFAKEFLSGPRMFNKKGHYEDERLVRLHGSAIKRKFPNSKGWIVTEDASCSFTSAELKEINNIIKSYESTSDLWAWKDPRTLLFMDSWKKTLPQLKILMVWRPANEVVSSLMRRSFGTKSDVAKIDQAEAIRAWEVYNEKILEINKAFPDDSLIVSLNDVINQQDEVLNQIIHRFDFPLERNKLEMVYEEHLLSRDDGFSMGTTSKIRRTTDALSLISLGTKGDT